MKTKTHIFVAAVLALMLIASVFMAALWLPLIFTYLSAFLSGRAFTVFQILCGMIGVVFFSILLSALVFPKAIAEDKIFTSHTAKRLKWLSVALLADGVLLCAVAAWLMIAGERLLMPAMLFVSLIGVMVALAIFVLSAYIARAAVLKEEADATL